ncbi:MAG: VanZ family protein [Turicibacter sp.]|nr:VanZ family protein [Turicibacter sp.]
MPHGGTLDAGTFEFTIAYVLVAVGYLSLSKAKTVRRNFKKGKHLVDFIFIFYSLFVVYFTLLPIDIFRTGELRDFYTYLNTGRTYFTNLEIANIDIFPFSSIIDTLSAPLHLWPFTFAAIIGNILLLFPLPIFLCLRTNKVLSLNEVLQYGFFTSVCIELAQLSINFLTRWPNRTVLVDDLILNTLGVFLGYLFYKKFSRFFEGSIAFFLKVFE